jgi:SOS-response transcriptional repressor LexA
MQTMTQPQARVLRFISDFVAAHGFGPSYREIAKEIGAASISTVHRHVTQLRKRGLIKGPSGARRYELVPPAGNAEWHLRRLAAALIEETSVGLDHPCVVAALAYLEKQGRRLEEKNGR